MDSAGLAEILGYQNIPLTILFYFEVWKLLELEVFLSRTKLLEN